MVALLAVDLGVRTGLALYGSDGRLRWYRSHNFGDAARLRRGVPGVLATASEVTDLIIEGGGQLAHYWIDDAHARGLAVRSISAEQWRPRFFYPREHQSGDAAKATADRFARRVIEWSGAKRPTSLRHDAAEAILVGLWGVLELGWLAESPLDHSGNLV